MTIEERILPDDFALARECFGGWLAGRVPVSIGKGRLATVRSVREDGEELIVEFDVPDDEVSRAALRASWREWTGEDHR